jgi:hypothetical protein
LNASTEETDIQATTTPLPLTRNLSLVFRISNATATLLVGSSIAGLLYGPRGWWYDADPATLPAFLAQDLMTLIVGVPLLLGSAFAVRRGSLRAVFCWMGALFYVAYSYYFYVIGARFNALFPVYIAIVSLGTYGTLALLFSLDLSRLASRFDHLRMRAISTFLIVTALSFAGMWLSRIDDHLLSGTPLDPVSRAVIAIDGVILLPLFYYGGGALARREPLGYALAGLLLVKATATFLTLIVSTVIASHWGRASDAVETFAYAAGFLAALALLVAFLERVNDGARAQ